MRRGDCPQPPREEEKGLPPAASCGREGPQPPHRVEEEEDLGGRISLPPLRSNRERERGGDEQLRGMSVGSEKYL